MSAQPFPRPVSRTPYCLTHVSLPMRPYGAYWMCPKCGYVLREWVR